MTDTFKYKAFISYSHVDRQWGDWLHRALERYRVPKRLAGQPGRDGPLPARLYPIFRDREELPTSADLGEQIHSALADSAYLIVICSPNAAKSRWVNEEILNFRRMGRDNRILALIVAGEPAGKVGRSEDDECFPPALRFALSPDGAPAEALEPLAADARPQGDGKKAAILKLIAGLLGVGFDTLKRRDLEAKRQRERLWFAAAAAAALIVAGGLWQIDRAHRQAIERQIEAQQERSRKFAEAAQKKLGEGDPDSALLIALEGSSVRAPAGETAEDRAALTAAYAAGVRLEESILPGGVDAATFSPDGRIVATMNMAGAQLWDAASGRPLGGPLHLDGQGGSLTFTPDGKRLVTINTNAAQVWDVASGAQIGKSIRFDRWLVAYRLIDAGTRLITLTEDDAIRTWDLSNGAPIGSPVAFSGNYTTATTFSPDGTLIAGAAKGGAQLYDAATGAAVGQVMKLDRALQAIVFSRDGRRLLTVSWNVNSPIRDANFDANLLRGVVAVWDGATGAPIGSPIQFGGPVLSAAFHPTGDYLVTGSQAGELQVWNIQSGEQIDDFSLHAPVNAVAFNNDRFLAAAGDRIELHDTATGILLASYRGDGQTTVAAFSPSGDHVLTGTREGAARIWNAALGTPLCPPFGTELARGFAAVSADGNLVATAAQGTLRLWNTASCREIGHGQKLDVRSAVFSSDGEQLLVAASDGTVRLLATSDLHQLAQYFHHAAVNSAIFNADDSLVLTASDDHTARLLKAGTLERVFEFEHGKPVRAALFSPDGARILTASEDDTAQLWDAHTGLKIGEPLRHEDAVLAAAFSSDGKTIATGALDGNLHLWDAASGKPLGPPRQLGAPVRATTFSADGSRLLTIAGRALAHEQASGAARPAVTSLSPWRETTGGDIAAIWPVSGQKIGAEPLLRLANVTDARFSADGTRVAAGFMNREAQFYDAETGAPLGAPLRFETSVLSVAPARDRNIMATMTWDEARAWNTGAALPQTQQRAAVAYLSGFAMLSDDDRRALGLPVPKPVTVLTGQAECDVPEEQRHAAPQGPFPLGPALDQENPFERWRRACEAKIAAEPNVGRYHYQLGRALLAQRHAKQALVEFERAAKLGEPMAYLALGDFYLNRQDTARAVANYQIAAKDGVAGADARLGDLAWAGKTEQLDRAKAVALWRTAADRGDLYANERLAMLNEAGDSPGIALDLQEALYRWAMAAERDTALDITDDYVRARRASLARMFVRDGKSDVVAQVWNRIAASRPSP